MVQASCVHTAVTAATVVCAVRAASTSPAGDRTSAAPPTAESGDPLSTGRVIAPPLTAPFTTGSGVELGMLPPPGPDAEVQLRSVRLHPAAS